MLPSLGFKISPFRKNIRKTAPHRHQSYYEIIYLSGGSGSHTIDNIPYTITPGTLFIVRQEQVHFWDLNTEPEGYVLIVKRAFVDQSNDLDLRNLFATLSSNCHAVTSDPHQIEVLCQLLHKEFSVFNSDVMIVEGLLKALLAKLAQSNFSDAKVSSSQNSYFNTFTELLHSHSQEMHKVTEYAERLHMTPQNLNSICQKEMGQSASDVISGFLIREAKRMLTYTDLPIVEITHSLGFKDPSHFTKYFKRYTDTSPNAYRKLRISIP